MTKQRLDFSADFSFLTANPQLCYLDNAATTQKPNSVLKAVTNYYRSHNANVHRATHKLSRVATEHFEQARVNVANLIHSPSPQQVIWTRGTTESINMIARCWAQQHIVSGDVILVSAMEHHANLVPWQQLASAVGARLQPIPLNDNAELDLDAYAKLLTGRVKLVALTMISNALGTINPVKAMIAQAHQVGAKVVLDVAQAIAHGPIDVRELDCDFAAFSAHKMYGPTGVGVLYGKLALLEQMQPHLFGGEMIEKVSFEQTTFAPLPYRLEAGTPNIAGVIGFAEAANFVRVLHQHQAFAYEQGLLEQMRQGLTSIASIRLISCAQAQAPMLSFVAKTIHHHDMAVLLDQQNIAVRAGHHCAMPLMQCLGVAGTIRASLAVYNTQEEVNRFIQAVDQIVSPAAIAMTASDNSSMQNDTSTDTRLATTLLKARTWQNKYRLLMLAGKDHLGLADDLKCEQYEVSGCETKVWLVAEQRSGQWFFSADAESRIVRGLLVLILEQANQLSTQQLAQFNFTDYLVDLDLLGHLSQSRGNGLAAIVKKIKNIAAQS